MNQTDDTESQLRSGRVRLRSVRSSDQDWLYDLVTRDAGTRWRYRGRTPPPGDVHNDLWRGVLAQFVVIDPSGAPIGLVGAYNANTAAGHCHVFAIGSSGSGPAVTEAAGMLISWVFDQFEFHKLWIESSEFNLTQFASLTNVADVEGRLKNFDYWKGRFWDLLILSVTRVRWDEHHRGLIDRATRQTPRSTPITEEALASQLAARLPLDSLAAVEILVELEDLVDAPVDDSILTGINGLDAAGAAAVLMDRLGLRPQHVDAVPAVPSGSRI